MVVKGLGFANGIIILDEPEAVYYSGQVISGNVHFELNYAVTCYAINVVCLGEALVLRTEHQIEMSGAQNREKVIKYEGREKYIDSMQCVFGSMDRLTTLPPGVHSMPFQFQVPFNAPSSFEAEDGNICYSVAAFLEVPPPGRKEELIKQFQVVAPISPDTLAKMTIQNGADMTIVTIYASLSSTIFAEVLKRDPLELEFEDIQTCHWFCARRPVNMKISLSSAVLGVGTVVPISVQVQNTSSVEIYEITVRITKRHKYRTLHPPSEYWSAEETVAEARQGPLLARAQHSWSLPLPLPALLLPNMEHCSVIDVLYSFKVKVRLTGCNNPVEEQADIVVGVLADTAVTSPQLAAYLPKAPVPDPKNQPTIGLIAPDNYTPQYVPEITSNPNGPISPYGFRSTTGTPPNPAGGVDNGRLYPTSESMYQGMTSYPNLQNLAILPSAPQL